MPPTRIFVVDDSSVVRRALAILASEDPQLELAGASATGLRALDELPHARADVVILDIEMPGMHGLQVLRRIRGIDPDLPVIMFSAPTARSASLTLEALAAGATDFVLKPSPDGTLDSALACVREQLFGKIKTLFRHPSFPQKESPRPVGSTESAEGEAPGIVAIGCSTGGPNALARLLPALRSDLSAPVLVVQHMPPIFTKTMADRLNEYCAFEVREVRDGVRPAPGQVWVAPGDHHLVARRERGELRLRLDDSSPINSCRPSVDVLFESLAERFGRRSLAVMLTGMGSDGLKGCAQIRAAGGQVIAQDRETSVVWGMPGVVAEAGLADEVLPLEAIAGEIGRRVGGFGMAALSRLTGRPAGGSDR